jgi:hypothetical protein
MISRRSYTLTRYSICCHSLYNFLSMGSTPVISYFPRFPKYLLVQVLLHSCLTCATISEVTIFMTTCLRQDKIHWHLLT